MKMRTYLRHIEVPYYAALEQLTRSGAGWHICNVAAGVLARLISREFGLPLGASNGADCVEVRSGIYAPKKRLLTEEQTYVTITQGGDMYYIDPLYHLIFATKPKRSILVRRYDSRRLATQSFADCIRRDFRIAGCSEAYDTLRRISPVYAELDPSEYLALNGAMMGWQNAASFSDSIRHPRRSGCFLEMTFSGDVKTTLTEIQSRLSSRAS